MNHFRTALLILALSMLAGVCAANRINYVKALDLGSESNQVSIGLADAANYSVSVLAGEKGIRITIPGIGSVEAEPHYRRLSKVIDNIRAFSDGSNAYVDIRTMRDYPWTHQLQGSAIQIMINPAAAAPVSEPKPVLTAKPEQIAEEPATPTALAKPDTLSKVEIPAPETKPKKEPRSSWLSKFPAYRALLLGAFALLTVLALLIFILFWRRRLKPEAPGEEVSAGSTLILDSETKTRLVLKLSEQGWKSAEIARELKLSPKEVEQIISLGQSSGFSHRQ